MVNELKPVVDIQRESLPESLLENLKKFQYWVCQIVLVFQTFADQTGLLMFDWCECEVRHHALVDVDPEYCQIGTPWFANVMEGSVGQHKEKLLKTIDDSVKQVHNMLTMVKGIANTHLNSSLQTFSQTRVYRKFVHRQALTATIPTHHEERNKWLGVFNMVAYLLIALETQVDNLAILDDEQEGKINMETEETVRVKLCPVNPVMQ
ncbi:hypothetical protein BDB00DRAFT_810229 [Zychaea mexicana]|uniref:uncharacterized protein n=1 Tax=Zychaea mexicana TaxID=64656 RepID=UPI0022FDB69A|nr:uncharacterized protein BDB00DRAFT_810229 [Zychaea mexicana]KAI9496075.1 hypothetical protein BDB00DRAFT_810229 [Zychaea mexicana]